MLVPYEAFNIVDKYTRDMFAAPVSSQTGSIHDIASITTLAHTDDDLSIAQIELT